MQKQTTYILNKEDVKQALSDYLNKNVEDWKMESESFWGYPHHSIEVTLLEDIA